MENKDKKGTSTKPAAVKEEAVVKAADKTVAGAKEVKPVAKVEEKAAEKTAEIKEEVKPEVKPEEKETSAKKAKGAKKPGKTPAKKKPAEKVEEVYLQYQEIEVTTKELVDKVKQIYVADGHRESSIKSLRLYIKPDEHMAYYVINEKMTGSVEL